MPAHSYKVRLPLCEWMGKADSGVVDVFRIRREYGDTSTDTSDDNNEAHQHDTGDEQCWQAIQGHQTQR
jgi:hypothetical protein